MILRKTLVEADIPRHDKMREAVLSHWKRSFKNLKLKLSVRLNASVPPFNQLTPIKSALVGISDSQWTFGQVQIWWLTWH
jgi:hypothetical protein